MNGTHINQPAFPTAPGGGVPTFTMENVDPSTMEEDSDSDGEISVVTNPQGLKPGKKTKGRVKIKMEFIENKLRRYTTFSKRKTGIMKKVCTFLFIFLESLVKFVFFDISFIVIWNFHQLIVFNLDRLMSCQL